MAGTMDVIDVSEREIRKCLENIMKLTKCIVCKEQLKPSVASCHKGHFWCYRCDKRECDICGSGVVPGLFQSTVNMWMMHMPRECKFSNRSCKAIILANSPHETYCPYSYECELCGSVDHIVNHFKTEHQEAIIPSSGDFYWTVLNRSQKTYALIRGSLFQLSVHVAKGYVVTEVYCLRSKRSDSNLNYTIEYSNGEIEYVYTAETLDYRLKDKYEEDNENFMKFPESKLPYLYEDGKLNYTFSVAQDQLVLGKL